MKPDVFSKYRKLYMRRHTASSGAALIFNEFLGLPSDQPVPLSLSHGVDLGHCYSPMDVESIEPIHWAYNQQIYDRVSGIKPALLIPHPWLMLMNRSVAPKGNGTLVIGPPPGPENDANLYLLIRQYLTDHTTVLVKRRGQFESSVAYWQHRGFKAISVGNNRSSFYSALFSVLSSYERIIGCTFSSALIFAAAMGKHVDIIHGYKYRSYDTLDYAHKINFFSNEARATINAFVIGNKKQKQQLALSLLGAGIALDRDIILDRYVKTLNSIDAAFHGLTRLPIGLKRLIFELAIKLDRPGLVRLEHIDMRRLVRLGRATVLHIDEFSVWENGPNEGNLSIKQVPYKSGITEPGLAVEQY